MRFISSERLGEHVFEPPLGSLRHPRSIGSDLTPLAREGLAVMIRMNQRVI